MRPRRRAVAGETSASLPTVFIVDDDSDARRAIARLLCAGGYQVNAFGSAADFLSNHDADCPGCVILDVAMPVVGGFELLRCLAADGCRRPVIFLTGYGDIPMSVRAMKAGAVDFLTKPVDERDLFAAVEAALRIDATERGTGSLRRELERRLATLTPRERQVLDYVVAGNLNKQIAGRLGTVEKTIKVHRARMMQKMGARSLAQLMKLVLPAGIGSPVDRARDGPPAAPVHVHIQ
jgi:FixJ family two-component response regulator